MCPSEAGPHIAGTKFGDYRHCPLIRTAPRSKRGDALGGSLTLKSASAGDSGGTTMDLVEQVRGEVTRQALAGKSFARDWPLRRRAILEYLGSADQIGAERVVGLGDMLSKLFVEQTRDMAHDRDQSSVSGGGVVWDSLVNLYLNMCYAGTAVVVLRERQIPSSLQRAFRVTHGTSAIDAGVDHIA